MKVQSFRLLPSQAKTLKESYFFRSKVSNTNLWKSWKK